MTEPLTAADLEPPIPAALDGAAGRLLIASNRLPVTVKVDRGAARLIASTGGLATAMKVPHETSGGLWFGWPGDMAGLPRKELAPVRQELARRGTIPIEISDEEVTGYYDRFANGVLWPLLHYLLDKVNLDAERDWALFREVNARFASAIAAQHRPGDQIWIHDYHLALVPGILRRMIPQAKIGFFLHVPFPSADVFRILPWREEILAGILGADLAAFHTDTYRHNFNHAAAHVLGIDLGIDQLHFRGRVVRTAVHPIGVDISAFARAAESPEVAARVVELRAAAAGKTIVLGIDRLDYTKGLPRRLLAIDRLLGEHPATRHQIHFIQLAVPTREHVDAYANLRCTVNELVGRVNARHGSATAVPVHLLYRSVSFTELVALYRAADVMLVTPLRDGMNLVAKEYVAARTDHGGTLVLSEFAGAACELPQALLVNPYDLGAVARAVKTAVEMPAGERALRMAALRRVVCGRDVRRWADEFLADLGSGGAPPEPRVADGDGDGDAAVAAAASARPSALGRRLVEAARSPRRLLILDYDGTMVPIAALPDLAVPDAECHQLLKALATLPGSAVHIVSGRDRHTLERWLGELPIGLHAEHGFWSRDGSGQWQANLPPPTDWKKPALALLQECARGATGIVIEEKTTAVAFHYRTADPAVAATRVRELRQALAPLVRDHRLELLAGSQVLEVRPRGVHKGLVVGRLCAEASAAGGTACLAAGDDVTDQDMFRALPPGSIAIEIGGDPSPARFQLAGPAELRRHLWSLVSATRRHQR